MEKFKVCLVKKPNNKFLLPQHIILTNILSGKTGWRFNMPLKFLPPLCSGLLYKSNAVCMDFEIFIVGSGVQIKHPPCSQSLTLSIDIEVCIKIRFFFLFKKVFIFSHLYNTFHNMEITFLSWLLGSLHFTLKDTLSEKQYKVWLEIAFMLLWVFKNISVDGGSSAHKIWVFSWQKLNRNFKYMLNNQKQKKQDPILLRVCNSTMVGVRLTWERDGTT